MDHVIFAACERADAAVGTPPADDGRGYSVAEKATRSSSAGHGAPPISVRQIRRTRSRSSGTASGQRQPTPNSVSGALAMGFGRGIGACSPLISFVDLGGFVECPLHRAGNSEILAVARLFQA